MTENILNCPHDKYFRDVMSLRENAESALKPITPPELAQRIDWSSMQLQPGSLLTPELQGRYTDLRYNVRIDGHDCCLALLIEHQSSNDPLMPFRLLEYTVLVWRHLLRDDSKRKTLPAVIPYVVHANTKGYHWTAADDIAGLLELDPETRTALGELVPRYKYLVQDLAVEQLDDLVTGSRTTQVRLMLGLMKEQWRHPVLTGLLDGFEPLLEQLLTEPGGAQALHILFTWVLGVSETDLEDLRPLGERLGPTAKEALMTGADRLIARGEAIGEARGEVRGEARGKAALLIRLLRRNFTDVPKDIVDLINRSDQEHIERWFDRALDAESLADVFAG